jgi:arylsulfatase A-like enzyme
VVARHRRAVDFDRVGYVRRYLNPVPAAHEWIAADWRYCRSPAALVRAGIDRLVNRFIASFDTSLAVLRNNRRKRYADAAAMADLAIDVLQNEPGDGALFLWCHFMDAHVPYCPGPGLDWYRHVRRYLIEVGYDPDTVDPAVALMKKPETDAQWRQWSALYDAVLRYIDEQIGRLVAALGRLGLAENTLIAVTADHGEELGEHGYISHYFRLYDHNLHVPMIFHGPGVATRRMGDLVSTLDFAPTVAALAGVPRPESWEGAPVTDPATSRHELMFETFFGGNCDFARRPLYLAVRTERYKYIWKEFRDRRDFLGPDGNELFDLSADPFERTNIYRPDHPAVIAGNRTIARRMAEIPEISRERIVRAFGPDVLAEATP